MSGGVMTEDLKEGMLKSAFGGMNVDIGVEDEGSAKVLRYLQAERVVCSYEGGIVSAKNLSGRQIMNVSEISGVYRIEHNPLERSER